MQCVRHCSSPDPSKHVHFEQPVWQTAQMFVGEMACWLVLGASTLYTTLRARYARPGYAPLFAASAADDDAPDPASPDDRAPAPAAKPLTPADPARRPMTGARVLLLALPALCDILGTTLMNVGLLFVAASIFQMTRGALVLFVGLFSVAFLRRRLPAFKWLALVIVVVGVAVVGLAGVLQQSPTHPTVPGAPPGDLRRLAVLRDAVAGALAHGKAPPATPATPGLVTLLGVLLIALAQVFTATQFVLEEVLMARYTIAPLATVAWEGTFGLAATLAAQGVAHAAYGRTAAGRGGYFDARAGWAQITGSPALWGSSLLIMLSLGGFNYFGLSVTRSVSATSRSTIDTSRTLFIWVVSLGLGWESFKWLQVLGFAGLVYGTFLFNEIVPPPRWPRGLGRGRGGGELLEERPIEHS